MCRLLFLALCSLACGAITAGLLTVIHLLARTDNVVLGFAGSFAAVVIWASLCGDVVWLAHERMRSDQ